LSIVREFTKGFVRENPVFRLVLGLCPVLAVTTSLKNGVGMGLAATFVLVGSNVFVSFIRKGVPSRIRIPCYIVVIASFVTVVDLVMAGYTPELHKNLGIFIPLIVVNCIIGGPRPSQARTPSAAHSSMGWAWGWVSHSLL
jgi:electron transport complex protein RnfE